MLKVFPSGLVIAPDSIVAIAKGLSIAYWTYPAGNKDMQQAASNSAQELVRTTGVQSVLCPCPGIDGITVQILCNEPCIVTVRREDPSLPLHNIPMDAQNCNELIEYLTSHGHAEVT